MVVDAALILSSPWNGSRKAGLVSIPSALALMSCRLLQQSEQAADIGGGGTRCRTNGGKYEPCRSCWSAFQGNGAGSGAMSCVGWCDG
jgi:hypothetical protein